MKQKIRWVFKKFIKTSKKIDKNSSFVEKTSKREGLIFFVVCFSLFFSSVGMVVYSFAEYQNKLEDLKEIKYYTHQLRKTNLLLLALSEEEKKNNQFSLAIDYGYAFSDDLVISLKYPESINSPILTIRDFFWNHWQYISFVFCLVLLLVLYKYSGFFEHKDRQKLALERLSTVFPALAEGMEAGEEKKSVSSSSWVERKNRKNDIHAHHDGAKSSQYTANMEQMKKPRQSFLSCFKTNFFHKDSIASSKPQTSHYFGYSQSYLYRNQK